MNETQTTFERHIWLSSDRAYRLDYLAKTRGVAEDEVIEKALDILFSLTDFFDKRTERQGWSFLSEGSLQPDGGNEQAAANASLLPDRAPQRNHNAFLKGYAPEDEGLYDDYPSR